MAVVFAVESSLRELCAPDKVNLASLGNQTTHVHWHVIPRFRDDRHFPDAVWGTARRTAPPRPWTPGATQRLRDLLVDRLGPART
jgi:diadenosine tetraphosphate (Ap4A) HIT family hydrolase